MDYKINYTKITFIENSLTADDFIELRRSVGWPNIHFEQAQRSIQGSLFTICSVYNGTTIGMARIIGDGSIAYMIKDVIVKPQYQNMGIGRKLMEYIMNYIKSTIPKDGSVLVDLMSAASCEPFYENFGFKKGQTRR